MSSIASVTLSAFLLASASHTTQVENNLLTVTVSCASTDCAYRGNNVELDVKICNNAAIPLEIRWDYLARRGAYVKIVNQLTSQTRSSRISFPSSEVYDSWRTIAPDETLILHEIIDMYDLQALAAEEGDVAAIVNIAADVRLPSGKVENIKSDAKFQFPAQFDNKPNRTKPRVRP